MFLNNTTRIELINFFFTRFRLSTWPRNSCWRRNLLPASSIRCRSFRSSPSTDSSSRTSTTSVGPPDPSNPLLRRTKSDRWRSTSTSRPPTESGSKTILSFRPQKENVSKTILWIRPCAENWSKTVLPILFQSRFEMRKIVLRLGKNVR